MVHIRKNPWEPQEFYQAKKEGRIKNYDRDMDAAMGRIVKESLFREQKGLCAYCMRELDKDTMQIEHYISQHDENGNYREELSVDYHNMLGVCSGGKYDDNHKEENLTCDQHRKNIPLTVDPLNEASVKLISYSASGEIYSDDEGINRDLTVTLNLNCLASKLVSDRKAAMDSFQSEIRKRYKGKQVPRQDWEELYRFYEEGTDGLRKEYAGAILYLIRRKLR